jgi:hypothetical protein
MKSGLIIIGALIGPFGELFGTAWLTTAFPDKGNCAIE